MVASERLRKDKRSALGASLSLWVEAPVKKMWQDWVVRLLLAALMIPSGPRETPRERVSLPIEVLGADGTTVSRSVMLDEGQSDAVRFLWLETHGLHYASEASVQVNQSGWIPLNNETVTVSEPGKSYGGIGGGFATLGITLTLPKGAVVAGSNTIRFRFNGTDGLASGYRVLAWNLLTEEGGKVVPAAAFVEDDPESWRAPLGESASIDAGKELWQHAPLVASSRPNSPRIEARCADCHTRDGRDLKYFNFSNHSIVTRSMFHGLSEQQGEQIASYIRSLPVPSPGRPWNPPYQPGPGLDKQAISTWAAGAGLHWVLERDADALPYLLSQRGVAASKEESPLPADVPGLPELLGQIKPSLFHPDGSLSPREIPIALQLPDWSEWLPRIHPKDAWGEAFTNSEFARWYDQGTGVESNYQVGRKQSLRGLLAAAQKPDGNGQGVVQGFAQWSRARRALLRGVGGAQAVSSPELSNKVYSTQLWQLVKTWEMMQEFGLEGRGRELFGANADFRTWCNTIPEDTAPSETHISDGPAGVGGSALTNEYFTAAWYELQIILNAGNHQHQDRSPVDWVYVIGRFRDLYAQTRQAEPTRLLVAVIKAWQSTDPRMGPDDLRKGWRPERNVDPRIMISSAWAPMFAPVPGDVRRELTNALLSAWMDKNLQYPLAKYMPVQAGLHLSYTPSAGYADISGGSVWEAAAKFREAGVADALVERLQLWGKAYTDRAARLQYH